MTPDPLQRADSAGSARRSWKTRLTTRPVLSQERVALLSALFFSLCCNGLFWRELRDQVHPHWAFLVGLFIAITALHALLIALVSTRWTIKPVLTLLFVTTAFAVYYMGAYKVYLDADMIRNVLYTDPKEARELFVPDLIPPLLLLAVLPTAALWWIRLKPRSWKRAALVRIGFLVAMVIAFAAGAALAPKDLTAFLRNQREMRNLITPMNYIAALLKVTTAGPPGMKKALLPIGEDARQLPAAAGGKPRLLVFVLGETARAQNWGLDGYARQTTPELAAMTDLIPFTKATSCGTSTEVSVPCLFSPYGRHDYDEKKIRAHQSLLHVLARAGIDTQWRDNQSGCKGVCDGLPFESLTDSKDPELCNGDRCLDEILLKGLPAQLATGSRDRIVVLHQLGNHGPAYFQRYPPAFRRFTPTCDTQELGDCTQQQIVNTYDNALLYTDHFLARTIDVLRQQTGYDAALLYVSDHGESLGEKGLFLHGMPYAIAPQEQTHVPMLMWLAPSLLADGGISASCLKREAAGPVSHDNLFPSILGLFQVQTQVYDASRDLFAKCRTSPG